jgi:hypothetical protein
MTDDYLGLLLAESCILFLNWYQKELRPIATAWAIEFLPLNKSLAVTDDRTNTRPPRIPQTNSTEPSTSVTSISIGSEYGRLTLVVTFMRSSVGERGRRREGEWEHFSFASCLLPSFFNHT